jgi:HEPN domain-containing protein
MRMRPNAKPPPILLIHKANFLIDLYQESNHTVYMTAPTAGKWFKQALHDLDMAEKNIGIEGYDVTAFLSHQAVEKVLKALHLLEGRKIPRSHFIDELAETLSLAEDILNNVYELTADYTLARYPDVSDEVPFKQYTKTIAQEKVHAAKEIFRLLRDRYLELGEWEKDE